AGGLRPRAARGDGAGDRPRRPRAVPGAQRSRGLPARVRAGAGPASGRPRPLRPHARDQRAGAAGGAGRTGVPDAHAGGARVLRPPRGVTIMARPADREGLLAAIRAAPEDDLPRLAYADWLDENGDEAGQARARLVRLQCEAAQLDRAEAEEGVPA